MTTNSSWRASVSWCGHPEKQIFLHKQLLDHHGGERFIPDGGRSNVESLGFSIIFTKNKCFNENNFIEKH